MIIRDLQLGRVDGKHEFLGTAQPDDRFFDAFLLPDNVSLKKLADGEIYFIKGFRGTGKTSLLRYFVFSQEIADGNRRLILFKSGLSEEEKLEISRQAGIQWEEADSSRMEVAQNFEQAWTWRIFHEIGLMIQERSSIADGDTTEFLQLLGLNGENPYEKVLGFLPRIRGASVQISANIPFFQAVLKGDLHQDGRHAKTSLSALNRAIARCFQKLRVRERVIIAFDELEAFFDTEERYHRDLRMVRDIIFSVTKTNFLFREHSIPIYLYAAIRTEILDAMRVFGYEVEREAHDFGITLNWHNAQRSMNHPLLNLIRRKLAVNANLSDGDEDILLKFFPRTVRGESLDKYLLDGSFYKPRDLIWRLTIAQTNFPMKDRFDEDVLVRTEAEYSSQLWKEVEYELSAAYNGEEIKAITLFFSGMSQYFSLEELEHRASRLGGNSVRLGKLLARKKLSDLLTDMYRLGAIGNAFRVGENRRDVRNRWIFRGDSDILLDRRMQLHPALIHRLSGKRGAALEDR